MNYHCFILSLLSDGCCCQLRVLQPEMAGSHLWKRECSVSSWWCSRLTNSQPSSSTSSDHPASSVPCPVPSTVAWALVPMPRTAAKARCQNCQDPLGPPLPITLPGPGGLALGGHGAQWFPQLIPELCRASLPFLRSVFFAQTPQTAKTDVQLRLHGPPHPLMLRTSLRSVRALGSRPAAAAAGRQWQLSAVRRAAVSGQV